MQHPLIQSDRFDPFVTKELNELLEFCEPIAKQKPKSAFARIARKIQELQWKQRILRSPVIARYRNADGTVFEATPSPQRRLLNNVIISTLSIAEIQKIVKFITETEKKNPSKDLKRFADEFNKITLDLCCHANELIDLLPNTCKKNLELIPLRVIPKIHTRNKVIEERVAMVSDSKEYAHFASVQNQQVRSIASYFNEILGKHNIIHIYQIEVAVRKILPAAENSPAWWINHRRVFERSIDALRRALSMPIGFIGMIHPSSFLQIHEASQTSSPDSYIRNYSTAEYLLVVIPKKGQSKGDIEKDIIHNLTKTEADYSIRVLGKASAEDANKTDKYIYSGALNLSSKKSDQILEKLAEVVTLERSFLRPVLRRDMTAKSRQNVSSFRCLHTSKPSQGGHILDV